VTGGGGKGIGRAVSLLLAQEDASVAVVDIDQKLGQKTVDLINRKGGQALFIRADVTKYSNVVQMTDEVIRTYGRVDILVNSAGGVVGAGRKLEEIDEEVLERNIALNLKSAIFCTKAVLPHMIAREHGSVVYISSINAILGFGQTAYASAKAGLHSLVQNLTADYSKHHLRFNVVCSGAVPESWARRSQVTFYRNKRRYPLKRFGKPDDVAHAVLFLASDDASWITGALLPVDGGITATGGI